MSETSLQTEEAITVKEYKHTHTRTRTPLPPPAPPPPPPHTHTHKKASFIKKEKH